MDKRIFGWAIAGILLIAVLGLIVVQNSSDQYTSIANYSSGMLFNTSQWAQFSYLIYPTKDSSVAAQNATSAFVEDTSSVQNGGTQIILNFTRLKVGYVVIVEPEQKLYFINDGPGAEGYAIVNQNGIIANVAYPLPGQ